MEAIGNLLTQQIFTFVCGPVAQWIRHLTTNQGIPGSSPGRVEIFQNFKRESN